MGKLLSCIVLCCLVVMCHTCSMLTHIEVAHRALSYFSFKGYEPFLKAIQKFPSSYQAGATFPDWGYPRKGYHQASEIAHWPPFYLTAAEYIQKTYPQPWSEEGERLIAFLAGATTHMVADVAWHSLLNVTNGFIRSMSCFGWDCVFSEAHSVADLGGDTVLAVQNDLSYMLKNWSIPVADIVEIYKLSGWPNVTQLVFDESMIEMYVGTMALLEGGAEVLYPRYNKIPGFLQDQFEDYFIGGLDDMAIWSTYCWPYVMGWFANGTGNAPSICLMMAPAMPPSPTLDPAVVPPWRFTSFPEELQKVKLEIMKDVVSQNRGEHAEISWSGFELPKPIRSVAAVPLAETRTVIYSQNNYSYFGYATLSADLNGDSLDDFIFSAPGYSNVSVDQPHIGCVYFLFGSKQISFPEVVDIEAIADLKICGENTHDRFGHALAVLDFNKDGVLDVAISSPTTNSEEMQYDGKVNVFFGSNSGNVWAITSSSNITISGDFYSNLGFTLTTGDVNADGYADLIVGAPFSYNESQRWTEVGFVAIYAASSALVSGQILTLAQADVLLNTPVDEASSTGLKDHAWFGASLLYVPGAAANNSHAYLMIGSTGNVYLPTSYLSQSGSVSIYVIDNTFVTGVNPLAVFYGNATAQLGYQLAMGSLPNLDTTGPTLAISMPLVNTSVPQAGAIQFISLNKLLQYIDSMGSQWIAPFADLTLLVTSTINSEEEFSRFGSTVAFVNYATENQTAQASLFVGYPLWTLTEIEQGIVCVWEGASFPRGEVKFPVISASHTFTSAQTSGLVMNKDARFGNSLSFGDMNGDGNTDVAIGSMRKSLNSYLGGAVELILS